MRSWLLWALLISSACVAKPEATRDGGTPCRREEDCNRGPLCGPVLLCVEGFCAADPVFRACPDGGYPDGGAVVECVTWVSCNAASCGDLVACRDGRCDPSAPPVVVPCDAGAD
ncbi:MAG: hypothetical protein U0324_26930 [Polyangiales bacterium]